MIAIQTEDFDVAEEYRQLCASSTTGAAVVFVGRVREFAGDQALWLEHYPGMTEKVLAELRQQAFSRWPLQSVRIIHRVGQLAPGDQIVLVGVSSEHRQAAFEACQWLMDILKTQVPLWKKEGAHWVEAKAADELAANRWLQDHWQE